jgi:Domain of unknown function (DUF5005)
MWKVQGPVQARGASIQTRVHAGSDVRTLPGLALVLLAASSAASARAQQVFPRPTVNGAALTAAWIPEATARKFCEIEHRGHLLSFRISDVPIPRGTTVTRANMYSADDWGKTFAGFLNSAQDHYYESITCNLAAAPLTADIVSSRPELRGAVLTAAWIPELTARKFCENERGSQLVHYAISNESIRSGTTVTRASMYTANDWGQTFSGQLNASQDKFYESITCRINVTATANRDELFDLYFSRCGPGWNGGDSTYSTRLSDDLVAWMFSDSYLGPVNEHAERRDLQASFLRGNVMVTQNTDTGAFQTYVASISRPCEACEFETTRVLLDSTPLLTSQGGQLRYNAACAQVQRPATLARALFRPTECRPPNQDTCGRWFWTGDVLREENHLRVLLRQMRTADTARPDAPLNAAWEGTFIGSIPLRNLGAEPVITEVPGRGNGVMYSAAVLPAVDLGAGSFTYVYGTREETASPGAICQGRCAHLARVPTGSLTQLATWRFWAGPAGWVVDATQTVPLGPIVPDEFSVASLTSCGGFGARCFVMLSHELVIFSPRIVARFAQSPEGPWSSPILLFETPEWSPNEEVITYNSHLHKAFSRTDGELVSYNVISPPASRDRIGNYRPRFLRVFFRW